MEINLSPLRSVLENTLTVDETDRWINTPNERLDGKTPRQEIIETRGLKTALRAAKHARSSWIEE